MSIEWVLILTVKMETEHPVGGSFGSEFPAICDHCVVMVGWSRKRLKFLWEIFVFFFEKRPLTVKFSQFCSESFHRITDRRYCVQISWNLDDGKSYVRPIYQTKKTQNFDCLSNCRYSADCIQNTPWPAPNNVLRVLQISSKIGSLSAEL